jgi:PilZ domain
VKWLVPLRRKPAAGDVATLVERGVDSPVVWEGLFTKAAGNELRLLVDGDFPFALGDSVLVASGPLGNRAAAFARLKGLHGNVATLSTLSPWLPVNRRRQDRYQAALPATIAARDGHHTARLLDISLGGLALAMDRPSAVGVSAVAIGDVADAPLLPVRVVGVEHRDDGIVLHAQFGTLTVQGHDYITHLVRELSASLELGLARVA